MIAYLKGTLIQQECGAVVIECNGVGYAVTVSNASLNAMPLDGSSVSLHIRTQMQESQISLYGFVSLVERRLFDLLITVKSVGPSMAMTILCGLSVTDLAEAIANKDITALTSIKKVGKKTAERIALELHEKCCDFVVANDMKTKPSIVIDVISALKNLGWKEQEASAMVSELDIDVDATVESLVRSILKKTHSEQRR